ncbi:MAG: ABC transporter permease [Bacteroidota bacterium]|nr:ABC transporter permease [Bacteroidota bacterium]
MFSTNLRFAYRNLKRQKIYSFINIAGLAVSLTACWLIALYVSDELSFDRFNKNADRIVRVVQHARWDGGSMNIALTSAPFAPALKQSFPEIEEAVRIDPEGGGVIQHGSSNLKVGDIIVADPSLFHVFTYDFLQGNAESALADPQAIVITEALARTLFGSADAAMHQLVVFPGSPSFHVTAVIRDIPENAHLRFRAVRPMPNDYTSGWQNANLYTYLLLKSPSGISALRAGMPAFAARTIARAMHVTDYAIELQPLLSIHLHSGLDYEISANGSISRVYIFSGIALLILLIAIINYVNLATARSSARIKEIGIRKTIGSGRMQLAVLFITEAMLVTGIAGIVALVMVQLSMPFFRTITGKSLSLRDFGIVPVAGFTLVFSLLVGLISGIYPSVFLSRFKTIPALKGNMGNISATILFRKSLLVMQFVITICMISASFVIYQQLQYSTHSDLGFNKEQVVTFHLDDRSLRAEIPAIKAKLLQNPLIEGVAAAGNPIGNNDLGEQGYLYEKNDLSLAQNTEAVQELMVDEDYLPTMQIKLEYGRNFSGQLPTDQTNSVIVNETLVKDLGWVHPIGMRMQKPGDSAADAKTVIGVIRDFHTYSLQHKVQSLVLIMPSNAREKDNLYVRLAKGKSRQALAYLDQVYRGFDPANPAEYHFLDQNFARQYAAEEKQGNLAFIFTVLAVLLSVSGLFGLVTFTTQQLTKEIGIRKVLGASVLNIVQLVSKDFLKLVALAALIALPVSWYAMHRWLTDFAYRIPLHWWVFVTAGSLSGLIALITLGIRAIQAARVNPVTSLHAE